MADYGNTLYLAIDARRAKAGADEFKRATDEVTKGSKTSADELGRLDRSIDTVGDTARSVGPALARGLSLAGIALGAREAIQAMGGFQATLQKLQTIGGATADELVTVRQEVLRLSQATPFGQGALAEGILNLVRAGQTVPQALQSITAASDLATVGELGLARAAEIVSLSLSQYRLEAAQSARVSDVLAAAANLSQSSVEGLADGFKNSATVANQLGISIESTAAALAALSQGGINGAEAGTGLRGVFLRLLNAAPEAEKALGKYGLTLADVNVKANGLIPVLQRLAAANISVADLGEIFGRETITSAASLIGSVAEVRSFDDALRSARGSAEKASAELQTGLKAGLSGLSSAAESLAIALGDSGVLGALTSTVNVGASLIGVLGNNRNALVALGVAWGATKVASWSSSIFQTVAAWNAARFSVDAMTGAMVRQQTVAAGLLASLGPLLRFAGTAGALYGGFELFGALSTARTSRRVSETPEDQELVLASLRSPKSPAFIGEGARDELLKLVGSSSENASRDAAARNAAQAATKKQREEVERLVAQLRFETEIQHLSSDARARATTLREAEAAVLGLSADEQARYLTQVRFLLEAQEEQAAAARIDAERSAAYAAVMRERDEALIDATATLGEFTRGLERNAEVAGLSSDEAERAAVAFEAQRIAIAAGVDDVQAFVDASIALVVRKQEIVAATEAEAAATKKAAEDLREYEDAILKQTEAAEERLATLRFEVDILGLSSSEAERSRAVREFETQTMLLQADAAARLRGEFERLYDTKVQGEARTKAFSAAADSLESIRREADAVFLLAQEQEKLRLIREAERETVGLSYAERQAFLDLYSTEIDRLQALQRAADLAGESARSIGSGIEAFLTGTRTGLEALRSTIEDVGRAWLRAFLIQPLTNDLFKGIGSLFGSSGVTVPTTLFSARGNAFSSGNVVPFASGGVVSGPTLFPLAGGRTGVMGEAGDEAIMPLARTAGGQLGVRAEGSGGNTIVHMTVYANDADSFRRSRRQIMSDIKRAGG